MFRLFGMICDILSNGLRSNVFGYFYQQNLSKLKAKLFLYLIPISGWLFGCANPGTPQGGPKDETPPVVKKSNPAPNSLNFKGEKITITFDELIQVKDINKNLVVSPPMNKIPSVVARGDELFIQFEDTLQDNTTYTLDFAEAVVDNNEGNVYPNFTFSFSTGEVVDSLEVSGHLWNAENFKPVEGALVTLYSNFADSAFQTLVPIRLAKTDKDGAFTIKNVRPGKYRIYALEDMNKNYKFDQSGENIGWSDSIIVPSFEYKQFEDSVGQDSVQIVERLVYTPDSLELFMYTPDFYNQYLVTDERTEKARLTLFFNEPLDSFKIEPVDEEYEEDWSIFEWSYTHDSLFVWIKDSAIFNRDSLTYAIQYAVLDTMEQMIVKKDTLSFYFFETDKEEKKKKPKKNKNKEEEEEELPKIPTTKFNKFPRKINLFDYLTFELKTIPVKFDPSGIKLYEVIDTIFNEIDFSLTQDSLNYRKFTIDRRWEPGGSYELRIDSATFVDIYGYVNDPISNKFSVLETSAYSTLYVNIENPKETYLLQVLGNKEKVVRQVNIPKEGKRKISFLKPGTYMLKMVIDTNDNGQWDSGDYETKRQPEGLYYYPEKITLRADWDHEVTWEPEGFNIFDFVKKFRTDSESSRRGQGEGRNRR